MTPFTSELAAARASQESWGRLAVRDRVRFVRNLRGLLVSRADEICAAELADVGRSTGDVVSTDLLPTAAALKFLEKRAAKLLAPKRISWWDQPTWLFGCRDVIHRRPWGAVGVIGTWNYPLYLNVVQVAQALVAGNAVLWKPSEVVPRTSALTRDLFREAGFPPDLLQVLPAAREAGPRLAETDVDHVVFTGSDAVGRKLASRLGERLVPSALELSGCDAMFVLADADLRMAARAAWFALTLNRGQTCIAVRRIFVPRASMAAFVAELETLVRADPLPLVMEAQKAQAERLIADATARGATRLAGAHPTPPAPLPEGRGEEVPSRAADVSGTPNSGSPLSSGRGAGGVGCAPTFLLNAPADAALCREACFAPLAAVIPFDTTDGAVELAKLSPFGLSASVFTADPAKGQELAARIPSGSVVVNDVMAPTAHPAAPFGGRGASGWGVTQGADGLLAMTVPQVVTVHKGTFRPHFDEAANPDPATEQIVRGLLTWTHARGLRAKLRGLWQMARGIRRKKK